MGYSGDYSLFSRCVSECFGTMTFVFFLECLLANKLLPKTKAHDLTYGWLAFGIGMAVFIPVQFLGFISTNLNPAMALGSAIAGGIDWYDFPCLALSELFGAFIGSVAMWVYYLPQFETDPEPTPEKPEDRLLHTRDALDAADLDFVSYSTRGDAIVPPAGAGLLEFGRLMSATRRTPSAGHQTYNARDVLGKDAVAFNSQTRRRSVTVAQIHSRIELMQNLNSSSGSIARANSERVDKPHGQETIINVQLPRSSYTADQMELVSLQQNQDQHQGNENQKLNGLVEKSNGDRMRFQDSHRPQPGYEARRKDQMKSNESDEVDPILVASHIADQNMKLTIFCTRPAKYFPVSNLLTEAMATFYLVIGILFIKERSDLLYEGYNDVYKHGFIAFFVGVLIFLLVLCLGGMGVAMNPARDLAPRFAHWILPVNGKGFSEWYYAWIPVVGPFIGGAVAGFVFNLMKELHKNQRDGTIFADEFHILESLLSNNL